MRMRWVVCCAVLMLVGSVVAAPTNEVAVAERTYAELQAENEALRRENQMLRRELVAKGATLPETALPTKGAAPKPAVEVQGEDTGYWISAKSKIRHNRRCRNYRKVKGRPCGSDDGKPCKMCGG